MRMHYEPDDDGFETARDVFVGRLERWAVQVQGSDAVDAFAVAVALDYRHGATVDGRLGLWEPRHVQAFLLDWAPRTLTVLPGEELPEAPEALRLLLRYLEATGLADPRGTDLDTLLGAVDDTAAGYPQAMADRTRWGLAKFWTTLAAEQGVDLGSPAALARFTERARRGDIPYDEDVLQAIAARHMTEGPPGSLRAEPQLPVTLPPPETLRAEAGRVTLLGMLQGLTEWAGREGRPLTATGRLKTADARELAERLGTGDTPPAAVRSVDDLPRLSLVFELARAALLVRVVKGRLYAVGKAVGDLKDPLALWRRAFDAVFGMRRPLLGAKSGWHAESMLFDAYEDILPDVLNTLYSLPHPMPWPRLRDSVDHAYRVRFQLGGAADRMWFDDAHRDLRVVLDLLEELGAVERPVGLADPVYRSFPLPAGAVPPVPGRAAGSAALPDGRSPDAASDTGEPSDGPVELIRLTALGTWAVRGRLLDAGRDAPLVGELAHAPAAGLLGILAEHYDTDSARLELDRWVQSHDGPDRALPLLLDAIRTTPYRTRGQAMLETLCAALPQDEGDRFALRLRRDPQVAPLAIGVLVSRGLLAPEDLTEAESLVMVAEGMLQFLEVAGADGFTDAVRAQGADFREALDVALTASHPDHAALQDLRDAAARLPRTPMARAGRRPGTTGRPARGGKPGRGRRR
ncbi:hypothetical protein [Streptomyces sp. G-G2]|uniref:hypothetical protein n=1 Tax=Streptomyces sp. G-G2 TaxID=3046201 RepID=UPI0024BA5BCC|nr:hypothetical protein [Streptomyces sp. G-G2]MDJ0379338.1 hypothetical protein [Streptomyces sp. G-G2]